MAFPDLQLIPFFQWLFRTSVQASVLVCLILAVQAVLRRKLGARWHYCLWLLLLVRLVMPGAPESSFSVFNLMPFGQERPAAVEPDVIVLGPTEPAEPVSLSMPAPVPLLPGQLDGQPIPVQRAPFRVQPVPLIWAFGALLVAIYAVGQNIALSSRIARQRQVTDEGVLGLLETCKETMGVRAYLSVVETPRVKSPALLGFIRPRLLLPEGMVETLDRDELRYVFLHELAHLKRRDIAVNWLMAALQLMHWFNPLIWYAFYRMRADREIACDALVLSRTQPGESKSYGRTIVSLLERFSQPRRVPGLAGIVEDKSQIKRRIIMIALFKRDSMLRSVVSLVLLAALACVVLTDARGAPEGGTGAGDTRDTVFVANEEEQAERDEEMAEMEKKLDTVVSLDFAKGTDIHDIVAFVSDFARVNIVLDERVMLPPPGFPTPALDDSVPKVPGAIEPTVATEMHRVYIKGMPLRNALEAAFKPAGLEYVVQPNFIWLSRPDVLRTETFPPTESRLIVPSGSGAREEDIIGQAEAVAAKLGANISADFLAGTDIRDVLSFLSDFAQVNIVLDERVMLPPVPRPTAPGMPRVPTMPPSGSEVRARPPVDGIDRTVKSETRRLYLKNILLGDALAVMLKQWGLDYVALPEYIWISRPDVLKKETFRAVETRLRPPSGEGTDAEDANAKMEEMREPLGKSVSLNFAGGTDIRDVFAFLAEFVGVNIVLDERVILPSDGTTAETVGGIRPTVHGHVHRIYLKGISLGDALIAMCKPLGLDYAVTPESIWISTPDVLHREQPAPSDGLEASSDGTTGRRITIPSRRTLAEGEETSVTERIDWDEVVPEDMRFIAFQGNPTAKQIAVIGIGDRYRQVAVEGGAFADGRAVLEAIDLEANKVIFTWVPTGRRYEAETSESFEDSETIPEETSEVSELMDVGVKLYADGYYRAAREPFSRVLGIDPENETAKKYMEECKQYLIPGRVGEDVEVEYPPTQTRKIAPSFMTTPAQSFRGLDLTTAPRTTRTGEPADLWEERPRGSQSYSIRDDVVCVYRGLDATVYHVPNKNCFYVKNDPVWSSIRTFVGPFEGDPVKILKLDDAGEVSELLDVGVKLYADGYYRDALDRFNRALALDPDNKIARKYAEECTQQVTPGRAGEDVEVEYRPMRFRPLARADPEPEPEEKMSTIDRIRRIEKKLRETTVTAHYAAGTDVRDVLSFLSDFAQANIVLDERVMLDSTPPRETEPVTPAKRPIEPSVQSEIADLHFEDTPGEMVLKAILEPMGLAYKVQPEFIWVSSPDIVRSESFEPLETRYYLLQNPYRAKKILAKLHEEIPDIIEPYTGETLSYLDLSPTTNLLIIHNTPSNFEIIEKILEREDQARPVEWPQTRDSGRR